MVRKFAPDYLVVGAYEDKLWRVDSNSLASLPVTYPNSEWTVYRLAGAGRPTWARRTPGSSGINRRWTIRGVPMAPVPVIQMCLNSKTIG
jgi:hypothetical protein